MNTSSNLRSIPIATSCASKPSAFLAFDSQCGHCLWLKPQGSTDPAGYILRQSKDRSQFEAQLHTHLPDGVSLKLDFGCAAFDVMECDFDVAIPQALKGMHGKVLGRGTQLVELLTDVVAWMQCTGSEQKKLMMAGMLEELLDDERVVDGLSDKQIGKMKVMAINKSKETASHSTVNTAGEYTEAKGG